MTHSSSYAEITMKSGAVVTFDCVSIEWTKKTNGLGETTEQSLSWELPAGAVRRPVRFDLREVAAVVFVDGTA